MTVIGVYVYWSLREEDLGMMVVEVYVYWSLVCASCNDTASLYPPFFEKK